MSLVQKVLSELHYRDSPNFLRPGQRNSFDKAADYGHIFRRAGKFCTLHGVYALREPEDARQSSIVPVVYVCETKQEQEAEEIHRLVWNQNVVPFVILISPKNIRLCSGFRYERHSSERDPKRAGVLQAAEDMNTALAFLDAFRAERIDNGTVWERWGDKVTPETRVDWKLLGHLNDLDTWLRNHGIREPDVSHALIGKYVYLRYLRSRDILSDRKLAKWGLREEQIFGRNAEVSAFWKVVDELDTWLNGTVFPLNRSGPSSPKQRHIQKVSGVFVGDDPATGQTALNFDIYDFSYIPIETLSVIYEQFLHAPPANGETSRGKSEGAYYTPVPLVNFMLEELDALHPFKNGMRVLDPSCGSGAFLVQCYRRIIERDKEFTPGKPMRPVRLRELLEQHIYGIDRDLDACRVAELSLSLTLLDYVDPPDLEHKPSFRLPELHDKNIFRGDFFDPDAKWRQKIGEIRFDWIVGNPPWVELKSGQIKEIDRPVWKWIQDPENQRSRPVGGNQVAEAFVWKVANHLDNQGQVALVLPAMTLFKDESKAFRRSFLVSSHIHAVANFANFADVLFPGHQYQSGHKKTSKRPRRPAAVFFYSTKKEDADIESIPVFSPFVADQPASRATKPGQQRDVWNIAIDAIRIREVDTRQVSDGNALPWKTAMWGSHLDIRLLESVGRKTPSFNRFCQENDLAVSQGIELRDRASAEPTDPICEGIAGQFQLDMSKLRNCGLIFELPRTALKLIPEEKCNVRRGRGNLPLRVCYPPHIIVDESRRFAVFSNEFIAVPPRQIGISGDTTKTDLLKALSLYLVSDFAIYHQFLTTPQWGISTSISTLGALKRLPVPISRLSNSDLSTWSKLHDEIVLTAREKDLSLFSANTGTDGDIKVLLLRLNEMVFELLELRDYERILVSDLVHVRMQMVKGKVTQDIIRNATSDELRAYAETLQGELDAFVEDQSGLRHSVSVFQNGNSAMLAVTLHEQSSGRQRIRIEKADSATAKEFAAIRERVQKNHSQWIYFRRNLILEEDEGRTVYLFKPLQRLHWTQSQALLDAGSIIAKTLS